MALSFGETLDGLDRGEESGFETFSAHWSLFVPSVLIVTAYLLLWFVLDDKTNNHGLARLALVVVLIGGPFLFLHAFLRYQTNRVALGEDSCVIRRILDGIDGITIPYTDIEDVRFAHGFVALPKDAGAVVITLRSGLRYVVSDIRQGAQVCERLRLEVARR
ncbi:hypothetical protein [Coralliovum pocilloporae]|uniref:hypothetical protein n=1 Tax=Coralliovum pocilloporae TaxID=3066369 RepID=UPI0033071D12